jgi:hypothetical protein
MRESIPSGDSSLLGCDAVSAVGHVFPCVARCRSAFLLVSRYSSTTVRTSNLTALRHFLGPRTNNSYVAKRKVTPLPWNRTPVVRSVASYRSLSYTGSYYTSLITTVMLLK